MGKILQWLIIACGAGVLLLLLVGQSYGASVAPMPVSVVSSDTVYTASDSMSGANVSNTSYGIAGMTATNEVTSKLRFTAGAATLDDSVSGTQHNSNVVFRQMIAMGYVLSGTTWIRQTGDVNGNANVRIAEINPSATFAIESAADDPVFVKQSNQLSGTFGVDSMPEMTVVMEDVNHTVTAGAYTAEDGVGAPVASTVGETYTNFLIQNITVFDADQQNDDYEIWFFKDGYEGRCADNGAFAVDVLDRNNVAAIVPIAAADWKDGGDVSVWQARNLAIAVELSGTMFYYQFKCVTAPTFTTTTSFSSSVAYVPK